MCNAHQIDCAREPSSCLVWSLSTASYLSSTPAFSLSVISSSHYFQNYYLKCKFDCYHPNFSGFHGRREQCLNSWVSPDPPMGTPCLQCFLLMKPIPRVTMKCLCFLPFFFSLCNRNSPCKTHTEVSDVQKCSQMQPGREATLVFFIFTIDFWVFFKITY